jgi:hypothetical protein
LKRSNAVATYVEYRLEGGGVMLVEAAEEEGGLVHASVIDGITVRHAKQGFEQAFEAVRAGASVLRSKLEELRADEVEVKFCLKAVGEAGNFAVGKVGMTANYEVTLKWKNE